MVVDNLVLGGEWTDDVNSVHGCEKLIGIGIVREVETKKALLSEISLFVESAGDCCLGRCEGNDCKEQENLFVHLL